MIKFFPDVRTFLSIGPLTIAWYAIFIVTGALIAYVLSLRNIRRMGYKKEDLEDLFIYALVLGVLGGRIWYVLFFDLKGYLSDPISIIRIWDGGLAIHGGLIAGVAYGYWYVKKHQINFLRYADAIVPNILIAQALGRWGNFMNQEAFGRTVSAGFYQYFPSWFRQMMFIDGAYREPTFLYESVLNLIGWVLITQVFKKGKGRKRGDLMFAYLAWYGVVRFGIEALRTDALMLGPIRVAQWFSALLFVVGVLGIMGVFERWIPKQKPIILFDFDGTLADTREAIIKSVEVLFATYRPDFELTNDLAKSWIGPSLNDSFARWFPTENPEELFKCYHEVNVREHEHSVVAMPQAKEVLEALRGQGYQIGIVSSKRHEMIDYGMRVIGLSGLVDVVVGVDEVHRPKPDPEGILMACRLLGRGHDDVIYIGDTVSDVVAGRNAAVYTVAYDTGLEDTQLLVSAGPNRCIRELSELLELIKEEHAWTISLT